MFKIFFQFFIIFTALSYCFSIANWSAESNKSRVHLKEVDLRISSVHLNNSMITDSGPYGRMERLAKCVERVNRATFGRKVGVFYQRNYMSQEILVTKYLQLISRDLDVLLHGNWTVDSDDHSMIQNVVLFIQNLDSLSEISKVLKRKTIDPKGKFVICISSTIWTEEWLVMLSKTLWKSKVANAVIVVSDIEERVLIYTYMPLEAIKCVPTEVFVISEDCYDRNFNVKSLFVRKMKNMNQCKIVASSLSIGSATRVIMKNGTRVVVGYEGKVFNTIADTLNFTKEITPVPANLWGDELPDGTWNGIHGNIKSGVADVGFCLMFPAANRLHFEEYSNPIIIDRYVWILPKPYPTNWNKVLMPFQREVWLAGITALIAAECFMYFVARTSKDKKSTALSLWGISLGQSILKTNGRGLVSLFLLCWTIYSFILTNAYQSGLVGFLTATSTARRLLTVEDLVASGMPFGGAQTPVQVYNNPDDPEDYWIFKNYQFIPLSKYLKLFFKVIHHKMDFATLVMESVTHSFKYSGKWYALEETASFYPSPFVFPKGSPYIAEFNIQITRLIEGGFVNYWFLSNTTGTRPNPGPAHIPLRVAHVASVFIFWLIGISISILIFIGEILCNARSKKKKRKAEEEEEMEIKCPYRTPDPETAEINGSSGGNSIGSGPIPLSRRQQRSVGRKMLPGAVKRLRTSSNNFESTRINAPIN